MPISAPSAMAPPPAPCPVAVNRRLTIRFGCAADAQINVADEILSPFQRVRVHDISRGGIALILPQAPAVGDTIFLQMTNNLLEFTCDLAAEVRHVAPHPRGSWLVGVAF